MIDLCMIDIFIASFNSEYSIVVKHYPKSSYVYVAYLFVRGFRYRKKHV